MKRLQEIIKRMEKLSNKKNTPEKIEELKKLKEEADKIAGTLPEIIMNHYLLALN